MTNSRALLGDSSSKVLNISSGGSAREPIVLELPDAPGVNNLYINVRGHGRVKSPKYRAWQLAAGWEIQSTRPGSLKGPVAIALEVTSKARGDIDGKIKSVVDLLVTHGVIEDDSKRYVKSVSAKWSDQVSGVRVTVSPV